MSATNGSERLRAAMHDVLSGRQATDRDRWKAFCLRTVLYWIDKTKDAYAADWEIAYDLQRAEKLIEREVRMTNEKDDARLGEFASSDHGDLPRPATSPSAHTPGPWHVGKPWMDGQKNRCVDIHYMKVSCGACGHSDGEYLVARTYRNALDKREQMPNAHLIAAAPDLLASLRWAVEHIKTPAIRSEAPWVCDELDKAHEAIAKAEGR